MRLRLIMRLNRRWCAILNCRTGLGSRARHRYGILDLGSTFRAEFGACFKCTAHSACRTSCFFPLGYGPSQNVRSDQRNCGFHALSMAILFLHLRNPRLSRTGVFTY